MRRVARRRRCFQQRGRISLNKRLLKDTLTTFSCFLPHHWGFYEDSAAQEYSSAALSTLYE